jgi:all-trans-retinol 13,14-reductase
MEVLFVLVGIGAVILVICLLVKKILENEHHTQLPRGFSRKKFIKAEQMPKHISSINDVYSKAKVPEDIDVIVIGSGIGGLACAGMLSRAGKRCLVLEQHYIAGGATHAFEEHGYEFDTGIHYIGNIEKRQKYLDLVTESPLEWDKMGYLENDGKDGCYDELEIGSGDDLKSYRLRAGIDEFKAEFAKKFPSPENIKAVNEYVRLCVEVSKKDLFFDLKIAKPRWLASLIVKFTGKRFFEMSSRTALDVVASLTPDKDLQAALLGQFGDTGQTPSTESFFMHASVANHYFSGGWYPRGGSSTIARGIVPVIERTGGRVLVGPRNPPKEGGRGVKSIIIEKGRAAGVEMFNGDKIFAKKVISAAGVFNTYKKLLSESYIPPSFKQEYLTARQKIEKIGHSCSFVYLFVGMEGTVESLGLRSSNIWVWPDRDYDKMIKEYYADPENAPIPMFLGFPCAKDSTWATRFPGKANAVILSMCQYDWFDEWKDEPQGKRGEKYDKLKSMFEKRILEEGLYKYYPKTRGTVKHTSVGSSLTFNHFLNSERGEVYGLEAHPERFEPEDWLRPESALPDLFLTGQDVTTLGVTGALMSGILTAHSVLGYGNPMDIMSGRNLVEDIWHLDKKFAEQGKDRYGQPKSKTA